MTDTVVKLPRKKRLDLKRSSERKPLNVSEGLDALMNRPWMTKSEKADFRIPKWVMKSHEFRSLTHPAKTMLLALGFQLGRDNNGCLEVTMSIMREFGIGSEHTLLAVKNELVSSELIYKTADGQFMNPGGRPDKYAIAWQAVPDTRYQQGVGIKPRPAVLRPPSRVEFDQLREKR